MNVSFDIVRRTLKAVLPHKNVHAPMRSVGHPDRDWRYLLVATVVGMVVGLGVTSITFFRSDITTHTTPGTARVDTLNRGALIESLETLRERQVIFDTLRRQPPTLVDPVR